MPTRKHRLVLRQPLPFSPPRRLADVSPGVQGHAKNPRFEVLNLANFRLMPPALDERLLQSIAGVFQVADEVVKRT
jgi:hypothetical protein